MNITFIFGSAHVASHEVARLFTSVDTTKEIVPILKAFNDGKLPSPEVAQG